MEAELFGYSATTESGAQIFVGKGMTIDGIELAAIQIGMKRNHGDKAKTAEELGVSLRTIYRKLDMISPREEEATLKVETEK